MTDKTYRDGLRRAEEIAVRVTDDVWNTDFARHGNKGLATMKSKLGHEIEAAIHKEWKAEGLTMTHALDERRPARRK